MSNRFAFHQSRLPTWLLSHPTSHNALVCCSEIVCADSWIVSLPVLLSKSSLSLLNARTRLSVVTAQLCLPKPSLRSECGGKDPAVLGSDSVGLCWSLWQVQFTL